MIVADTSWIVALRDPGDVHHGAARAVNDATSAEVVLLHPLTLAECLVGAAKLGALDEAATALRAAYDIPDVDRDAPVRWARLRADTGLRLPDAVVLDTALTHGATTVLTFDDRLAAATMAQGLTTRRA